jgi:periplasmic divalent cation tolerance protein
MEARAQGIKRGFNPPSGPRLPPLHLSGMPKTMLMIVWTTVVAHEDADRLATTAVELNLAACVQIAGPITSHYRWEGKHEHATEFRLTFKCLPAHLAALETHILAQHPYQMPEWIVVSAAHVTQKYLSWARANAQSPPL